MARYTRIRRPAPPSQFRLATGMVMMFVAAAWIFANTVPWTGGRVHRNTSVYDYDARFTGYGFPNNRMYRVHLENPQADWPEDHAMLYRPLPEGFDGQAFGMNLLIGVTVMALSGVAAEAWFRHRDRRRARAAEEAQVEESASTDAV